MDDILLHDVRLRAQDEPSASVAAVLILVEYGGSMLFYMAV